MKKRGVPVSKRALMQRINRVLNKDQEQLLTARGFDAEKDLGKYYVLNHRIGAASRLGVDLEELGRELGVLKPHETFVE